MKPILMITILLLGVYSCKKDKPVYRSFSEQELEFVSYAPGQTIKFIDTNQVIHTFLQDHFYRAFDEFVGMFGNTGDFQEEYEVAYNTSSSTSLYLTLFLYGGFYPYTPGELVIDFCTYKVQTNTAALLPAIDATTINGQTYTKVYSIKMYKNGAVANNSDTATLLYNRQYGVIQLKLPSGKTITRTE